MTIYPQDSDFYAGVSASQRDTWEAEKALRDEYRRYFTGEIFEDTVPLETGTDDSELPLLYPVGLNLVKMLCTSQAEALFGEWEEDIVRFKIRQDAPETPAASAALELVHTILNANNFASIGYELSMDREIYGGCVIKIAPDLGRLGNIGLNRIELDSFYPVWNPDNPDELLEVWIRVLMTREQAKQRYGYDGEKDKIERTEHWTKTEYENKLDGKRMDAYSGVNPWGIVPIEFIPRIRTQAWWGDPLTPDITAAQDELNMRVADLGESINYNSHPTRFGSNLPRNFNSKNFPLGAQSFWDLGRSIGRDNPPTVGLLEARAPIPERSLEFINFLYDWSRTSAFAPPIAFGEDQGGGQRSGRTLEIRMWPLLRATRRSRAYFAAGLMRIMKTAAIILRQKGIENVQHSTARILDGTIIPSFFPLMPKDTNAIVDNIVKLFSTPTPIISLETAQKWLNLGPAELDRVKAMLNDSDFADKFSKPQPAVSDTGNRSKS